MDYYGRVLGFIVLFCWNFLDVQGNLAMRDRPLECITYKELKEGTRRFDANAPTSADNDLHLKKGWYRFIGSAGNSLKEGYEKTIPNNKNAPNFCGTEYAGTLMGSHPTVEEGIVEMTVCFRAKDCFKIKNVDCGCTRRKTIYVINCIKHYVYFLSPTLGGERYCSADTPMRKSSDTNTSSIVECNQNKMIPNNPRVWNQVTSISCDKDLYGWFRFDNGMASDCEENDTNTSATLYGQPCGATFRGWMQGRHPEVNEGRVQRRVCFSYNKKCFCEFSTNILVRNCKGYYVYRLNSVPICESKYCSAPKDKKDKNANKPKSHGPKDLCTTYKVLYDPDRLWSYTSPTVKRCDADLYGQYRFGSKYTPWKIKEGCDKSDSKIVLHRCGSDLHGFMVGIHPTVKDGYVERVICFQNSKLPCECKHTTKVGVQNCTTFYVYYFTGTPTCNARYCMVANNSADITIDPGVPSAYKIPPPDYVAPIQKIKEKDEKSDSGLIATTTALSFIILIVIIVIVVIIVIFLLKRNPEYKERKKHRPLSHEVSVASSAHSADDMERESPTSNTGNGDVTKHKSEDRIGTYPSVPKNGEMSSKENTFAETELDVPQDLEMNGDDEPGENDNLLKSDNFNSAV